MRREYSILVMLILCASALAGCIGGEDLEETVTIDDDLDDAITLEPMTVEEFTALLTEGDELNPLENISKAGTRIVVCCSIDIDQSVTEEGETLGDVTVTLTNAFDHDLQRIMSSSTVSVDIVGAGVGVGVGA